MKRIVLTGGPGAGKSQVAAYLSTKYAARFVAVPEAATQVFHELHTRWDLLDDEGRRDLQRRIYRLQLKQEEQFTRECPDKTLLLDRGSVDGAAYWPDGPDDYWRHLNTTLAIELARYDAVIWLQCSAAVNRYDGDSSNPCRSEDPAAAIACGDRIARLWSSHPGFHRVNAYPTLAEKIARVEPLVLRY
ncbi:MAG TPA: ATP-binding protein [Tepidisphaeraceae bacterium]|nr:ATP-binding protein [Tepidisphaeraceae bacterium]